MSVEKEQERLQVRSLLLDNALRYVFEQFLYVLELYWFGEIAIHARGKGPVATL